MANTYTQIYLHVVFAVSARACVISSARREEHHWNCHKKRAETDCGLFYARSHPCAPWFETKHRTVRIDWRYQDRVDESHQRAEMDQVSFSWQEGYGAFSVSHSHLDRVVKYIRNQPTRHRREYFQQEYVEFLERHHVPYDQRYIFKPTRVGPEC